MLMKRLPYILRFIEYTLVQTWFNGHGVVYKPRQPTFNHQTLLGLFFSNLNTVYRRIFTKALAKMVKVYFLVALLFVAVAAIAAAPVEEEYEPLEHADIEERAVRQRRVTCDLLSIKGVAEHSACAANCLSMGKAGGRCENGICLCRKTTFKELWDKRFG